MHDEHTASLRSPAHRFTRGSTWLHHRVRKCGVVTSVDTRGQDAPVVIVV
jgi:hypothetical protein